MLRQHPRTRRSRYVSASRRGGRSAPFVLLLVLGVQRADWYVVCIHALPQDFLFNTRSETTKKQRITADGRGKGKKKDSKKRKGKKSNDAIAAAMERKFDLTKAPRNAELLSFKVCPLHCRFQTRRR